MNYYFDVEIKQDSALGTAKSMAAAYSLLHIILVNNNEKEVGVSFPCKTKTLGNILRIHGGYESLSSIATDIGWSDLTNYCLMHEIKLVPEKIDGYVVVSRVQCNMNNAKLRRLIKRKQGSFSESDIIDYRIKMHAMALSNQYIDMPSLSTKRDYRRFFKFIETLEPKVGFFDSFGLSKYTTVPIF